MYFSKVYFSMVYSSSVFFASSELCEFILNFMGRKKLEGRGSGGVVIAKIRFGSLCALLDQGKTKISWTRPRQKEKKARDFAEIVPSSV